MPPHRRLIAPALLALALLSACAQAQPSDEEGGAPPGAASSGGEALLNLSAPALGGGTIDGQDYAGKDVAIWFWAPW